MFISKNVTKYDPKLFGSMVVSPIDGFYVRTEDYEKLEKENYKLKLEIIQLQNKLEDYFDDEF